MSTFLVSLNKNSVSKQISDLINTNNRLRKYHTFSSILHGRTCYLIETAGYNVNTQDSNRLIIGCIGLEAIGDNTILLKHLSVHTEFRSQGIANKLISDALRECRGKKTRMRIRADNKPSLYLAEKYDFLYIFHENLDGYSVLTVERGINNVV